MINIDIVDNTIKIKNCDINLDKTFNSGQCFRWNKYNNRWIGVVGNKIYTLEQDNDTAVSAKVYVNDTQGLDINNLVHDLIVYLDLETDYSELKESLHDDYAIKAYNFSKGIKILNQDIWETIISFIISQRNNIPKIKSTIEKLCIYFGDKLIDNVRNKIYTFPSADILARASLDEISKTGCGYRTEYIKDLAVNVSNGSIDIKELITLDTDLLLNKLQSIYGIGPKIANCISLYGLHRLEAFPIDVWMQRIIDREYNGNINIASYGKFAGVMQQYMFYYERRS